MVAYRLAPFLLLAWLSAQERADRERPLLPRLFQIGPPPAAAPAFELLPTGALAQTDGTPLTLAAFEQQLAGTTDIVLHADRRVPTAAVIALLDLSRTRNVKTVWFAATLPDGTGTGSFGYALPASAEVIGDPVLRLHRDRAGVPPESVEPHLHRIARALATARPDWVLGIEASGDAGFETVLQVMAAAAQGGVSRAVVTTRLSAPQQRAFDQRDLAALAASARVQSGAHAIDLGPLPQMQVPAQALPRPRALAGTTAIGLREQAVGSTALEALAGWGGRYGGRLVGRLAVGAASIAEAIEQGPVWVLHQQLPGGSWPDAGGLPDLEGTALVVLAFHGDGQTMESGPNTEAIRRGVGWLMSQQQPDGSIGPAGPGCVRKHALAVYALCEACGLSPNGRLMRGSVEDALAWLMQQRRADGGWNDGTPDAPSDAITTHWCVCAISSARFFQMQAEDPAAIVTWFDTVAGPGGVHRPHADAGADDPLTPTATAAALFARFLGGQDPKDVGIMRTAADVLRQRADPGDPLGACFATYALYQIGGRHWLEWSKRLDGAIVQTQITSSDAKGSWPAAGGLSPVATTALRVLTLEAYYRYTRLIR